MGESGREGGRNGASGSESRGSSASGSDEPRHRATLGEWIRSGIIAFVLYLVIRSFLVQTFVITSGSMEETLLVGDFLMVNRVALGSRVPGTSVRLPGYSEPHRWDVTVFDPPHEDDLKLVKRLVGMPGDTVAMDDKTLYLNGEAQEEPYVRHEDPGGNETHPWMSWQREYLVDSVDAASYQPTRDDWGPLVIPDGHYFMLGDNRDSSLDSRYWGLLERWRLEGRAVFIYFSYDKESLRPFPWVREVRWNRIGDGIR